MGEYIYPIYPLPLATPLEPTPHTLSVYSRRRSYGYLLADVGLVVVVVVVCVELSAVMGRRLSAADDRTTLLIRCIVK